MTTAELLALKYQEILGAQYLFRVNHAFEQAFTKSEMTPYGMARDINYQAFAQYSDVIVAVVGITPIQLVSTPYRLDTAAYTVDFWVPVDFIKYTQGGELAEPPKFDFYCDMMRLAAAVKNTQLTLNDGDEALSAFVTISEPTLQSMGVERSGAYKRVVMRVSGNISLADPLLKTGADIEIGLIIEGTEHRFKNISNVVISSTTDANAILDAGSLRGEQAPAQVGQTVSFDVDDYDAANDAALKLVADKAWQNIDILTPTETRANRLCVKVRLRKGGSLKREFWGVLNATYSAANKAAYGKYSVSIASGDG